MMAGLDEVSVSLVAGETMDHVALSFTCADGKTLVLTPAQARALATDLITAVNRAEVKSRLKTVPSLWERSAVQRDRMALAA
jgi:hypothetical protein